MVTIKQILQQAACEFTATPFELHALLAHVLNKTPTWLKTWPEYGLTAQEQQMFHALCLKHDQGQPIAYLLGQWAFWSFHLQVTPATLIPRPETEHLVEWVLTQFDQEAKHVLDLGTGSGAIALALGLERPAWKLTATDISPEALVIAKQNAANLQITNIEWVQGNWFQALSPSIQYDVIVSNPPYIASTDPHLSGHGLPYEPQTALVAAEQGLADLRAIITQSSAYLLTKGWLVVEHGYNQAPAVRELFLQNHYQQVNTLKDYGGQERMTYGQKAT